MSKKEAIAEAKKLEDLEIEHKKMTEEEEYRNAGISKEDAQGRGELDLERQITELKLKLAQLSGIEKMHKDLNGMLRQENYDLKMKVHGQVKLENQINGQKQIIEELTADNQRLSAEIDDKVKKLRNSGAI